MDKCAHCSVDFKAVSGRKYPFLIIPTQGFTNVKNDILSKSETEEGTSGSSHSCKTTTVSVLDAFKSIFCVPQPPQSSESEPDVNVCSRCCGLLENTYKLVTDLSLVRATDSFCARKILERDDLISRSLASTGTKKSTISKKGHVNTKNRLGSEAIDDFQDQDSDIGEDFIIDEVSLEIAYVDANDYNDNSSKTGSPGKKPNPVSEKKGKGKSRRSALKRRNSSGSVGAGKMKTSSKSPAPVPVKQPSRSTKVKGQANRKVMAANSTSIATVTTLPESQVKLYSGPVPSGRPSRHAKLNAYAFMNVSAENESSAKQILSKKNPVNTSTPPVVNTAPSISTNNKASENLTSKQQQLKRQPPARSQSRTRHSSEAISSSTEPTTIAETPQPQGPKSKSKGKIKNARQTKAAAASKPKYSKPAVSTPASLENGVFSTTGSGSGSKAKGRSASKNRGRSSNSKADGSALALGESSLTPLAPAQNSSHKKSKGVKVLATKKPKVTANPRSSAKGKGKAQTKGRELSPGLLAAQDSAAPLKLLSTLATSIPALPGTGDQLQQSSKSSKGKGSKKSKLTLEEAVVNSVSQHTDSLGTASSSATTTGASNKPKSKTGSGTKGKGVKAKIILPKKSKVPKVKVADASTSASPSGFAQTSPKVKITEMETQTEHLSAALLIQQREEALDLTYKALQDKKVDKKSTSPSGVSSPSVPTASSISKSSGSGSSSNSILVPPSGSGSAKTSSIIETPKRKKAKQSKSVKFAETVSKLEIPGRGTESSAVVQGQAKRSNKKGGGKTKSKKGSANIQVPISPSSTQPQKTEEVRGKKSMKNLKKDGQILPTASSSPLHIPPAENKISTEVMAVKSNPVTSPTTASTGMKFPCPDCDYEAPARFNLQRHQIGVHELKDSTGPPFTCSACVVTFGKKSDFVMHRMGKTCGLNAQNPTDVKVKNEVKKVNKSVDKKDKEKSKEKVRKTKSKKRSVEQEPKEEVAKGKSSKSGSGTSSASDLEPKAKKPKLSKSKKEKTKAASTSALTQIEGKAVSKPKPSRKRKKDEINGSDIGSKEAAPSKSFRPDVSLTSSTPSPSSSVSGEAGGVKTELKTETLVAKSETISAVGSDSGSAKAPHLPLVPSASANAIASTKISSPEKPLNSNSISASGAPVELGTKIKSSSSSSSSKSNVPVGSDSIVTPPPSTPPTPASNADANASPATNSHSSDETTTTLSSESSDNSISTSKNTSGMINDEGKDKEGKKNVRDSPSTTMTSNNSSSITGKELLVNSVASGKEKDGKVVVTSASTTTEKTLVTMSADSTTGSVSGTGAGAGSSGVVSGSSDTTSSASGTVNNVGVGAVAGGSSGAGSGATVGVGIGA